MSTSDQQSVNPDDFIITRKRKLYKFAAFRNLPNCHNDDSWTTIKKAILDNNRPITLEIGAGTALFSTKLAELHNDRQFIAIDRKSDRLYKGAKLANELGLSNIIYLWSNARNVSSLLPASSVQSIWITFPDPWPQESNIKHRLTNPKFLNQYYKLLTDNGTLNFKTDNCELFNWSIQQLDGRQWQLNYLTNDLHSDGTMINQDAAVMTTYEERYVAEGKPICYLRASRIGRWALIALFTSSCVSRSLAINNHKVSRCIVVG